MSFMRQLLKKIVKYPEDFDAKNGFDTINPF